MLFGIKPGAGSLAVKELYDIFFPLEKVALVVAMSCLDVTL